MASPIAICLVVIITYDLKMLILSHISPKKEWNVFCEWMNTIRAIRVDG